MINLTDKYKTRCGYPVEVLCIDLDSIKSVLFTYVCNGKKYVNQCLEDGRCEIMGGEYAIDLIKVTPYDHIKKGDVVLVWDDDISTKYIKFFIEYKNSYITTSPNTDFTKLQVWENCELYNARDEK